jgi:hypothetical protein
MVASRSKDSSEGDFEGLVASRPKVSLEGDYFEGHGGK